MRLKIEFDTVYLCKIYFGQMKQRLKTILYFNLKWGSLNSKHEQWSRLIYLYLLFLSHMQIKIQGQGCIPMDEMDIHEQGQGTWMVRMNI